MKLSDYVVQFIHQNCGLDTVFLVVGGGNMHLVDSVARNPNMHYVCMQHEQAASIAAEGYARVREGMGFALGTSGPGGSNMLTGLACSWMDSVPVLFITGQVSRRDCTDGKTIRQLGVQQIHILPIVQPVTKYAVFVDDPAQIRFHLEKAVSLAKEGRPGPVWLDIPQDVQMSEIDPENLVGFIPEKKTPKEVAWRNQISEVVRLLENAERPVLIVGNGVRLSGAKKELDQVISKLRFPLITTWNAIDLVEEDHPLYVGRSGVFGQYGANFAVANADLILSVGSRLDTRQTGTRRNSFARGAKKIAVDISEFELKKGLLDLDVAICADARQFLTALNDHLGKFKGKNAGEWQKRCQDWKKQYPVTLPEYHQQNGAVNSYVFVESLCRLLDQEDVVVTDMGTSLSCTMQTFKVKKGQRLFTNTGFAPMGYGLPGAIGAWFGTKKKRLICLSGDGGLQMNIQEFQTLFHYKIPLKLFILNNREYVTIKHTQTAYFQGRYVASEPNSGYSAPDFEKVARAYGLETDCIRNHGELETKIKAILSKEGSVVCDVRLPSDQPLLPILLQHRRSDGTIVTDPIERLSPYLPEEEFRKNMIVPPLED
ncbi:MAG: thiamine pyrophosphate-binding protein [Elusimicrobia bacterium]|nr:thiamine pyrophosphate-binding protein [Elusimicrobiota bacterium]